MTEILAIIIGAMALIIGGLGVKIEADRRKGARRFDAAVDQIVETQRLAAKKNEDRINAIDDPITGLDESFTAIRQRITEHRDNRMAGGSESNK